MENGNCTKGLLRAALVAALALMFVFTAACGESECGDDEKLVALGDGEQCLSICDTDEDCDGNATCHSSQNVCVPGDDDTNTNNGDPECTSNDDCDGDDVCEDNVCVDPGTSNTNTENGMSDDELCTEYCELLYGCLSGCGLPDTGPIVDGCKFGFEDNDAGCMGDVAQDRESIEEFVFGDFEAAGTELPLKDEPNTCDDMKWLHCGSFGVSISCGMAGYCQDATTVGDACNATDDCDAGDLMAAECMGERDESTGELVDGGTCTAYTCFVPADPMEGDTVKGATCGEGNGCMALPVFEGGQLGGICQSLCDSHDACGADEACVLAGRLFEGDYLMEGGPQQTGGARICIDQCELDEDCGQGLRCGDAGDCQIPCEGEMALLCGDAGGTCTDFEGTEYCVLD